SLRMQVNTEKLIMKNFPEVKADFARTGTAEVATEVMLPIISDAVILLKPHDQWPIPKETLSELRSRMKALLATLPGNTSEIFQPFYVPFN
ncbi:efflux RND transporter permease subunit, partial [Acinetobacter baumannii]|uniref:efflux RND transporter permease subunit n=1 Tax=Acinetobacter baumannii TaxID=470 RepID=UPI000A7F7B3B